jgi:hypothetical protein
MHQRIKAERACCGQDWGACDTSSHEAEGIEDLNPIRVSYRVSVLAMSSQLF